MKNATSFVFSLLLLTFITHERRGYGSQALAQPRDECLVRTGGVRFTCPPGWNIVDEDARGITIGNFKRAEKATNLTIPAGHATIKLSPMPKIYRDLEQWIYAGSKMAPESIQTQDSVTNDGLGPIPVTVLSSPQSAQGLIYESYFFVVNGKPLNLELSFQRASKNAADYRALGRNLIANLESSSGG